MRHHLHHSLDRVRERKGFRLKVLPTRKSKHAFRQGGAARRGLHRPLEPAREAIVCFDAFARHFDARHDDHQKIVEVVRQPAGKLAQALQLLHLGQLGHSLLPLSRSGFDSPFQFLVGGGELGGPLGHAPLEFGVEALELTGLPVKLAKHAHFGAHERRHDRDRQIIHGASLVASQAVDFAEVNGGHENDRSPREARVLPDHLRQFEAVELGHGNIDEDDSHLMAQELLERLTARRRLDEIFAELLQDHLITQELRRVIVDQKYIHRVAMLTHSLP